MKSIKFFYLIFSFCVVSAAVRAAVAPEYADNSYSNHELTRAEKNVWTKAIKSLTPTVPTKRPRPTNARITNPTTVPALRSNGAATTTFVF